ncbi:hypothetical protein D3C76_1765250 [compost metagenome]
MRLIGQAGGGGHFGGGHTEGQKGFGTPQADRHQHLMRRDVKVSFKLALEMVRTERHHTRQFVQRHWMHIVVVQILAHPLEAM